MYMYVYIHLIVILNKARSVSLWLALNNGSSTVYTYIQCILPLLCSPHFVPGLPSAFYPRSTGFILPSVCRLHLIPSLQSFVRRLFYTDWQELCVIYNFWHELVLGSGRKKKTEKRECWSEEVVVVWHIPSSKGDKSICPGTKFVLYRLEFINGVKCMHVTVVCTRLYLDF